MQRASLTIRRRKLKQRKQGKYHSQPDPIDDSWALPCDVRLAPSIHIPRGSTLKTLLTALHAIEQTRSGSDR
jgi:hypothetical protein